MTILNASKKQLVVLLALTMAVFWGYAGAAGADETSSSSSSSSGSSSGAIVCTDAISHDGEFAEVKLYYPCYLETESVAPHAAATMAAGYAQSLNDLEWLADELAARAFNVVLTFRPVNIMGLASGWRDAYKNSVVRLNTLNDTHAILKGKIDTNKITTLGYAKAASGALWAAAQLGSELAADIAIAPTSEGISDSTLASLSAATLLLAGANDTAATPAAVKAIYNALGDIDKCYSEYDDYGHMDWMNADGKWNDRLRYDIKTWIDYHVKETGGTAPTCDLSNDPGGSSGCDGGGPGGCN